MKVHVLQQLLMKINTVQHSIISVCLRLGMPCDVAGVWSCGAAIDAPSYHALSCYTPSGRNLRHAAINLLCATGSFSWSGVSSSRELCGLEPGTDLHSHCVLTFFGSMPLSLVGRHVRSPDCSEQSQPLLLLLLRSPRVIQSRATAPSIRP